MLTGNLARLQPHRISKDFTALPLHLLVRQLLKVGWWWVRHAQVLVQLLVAAVLAPKLKLLEVEGACVRLVGW